MTIIGKTDYIESSDEFRSVSQLIMEFLAPSSREENLMLEIRKRETHEKSLSTQI